MFYLKIGRDVFVFIVQNTPQIIFYFCLCQHLTKLLSNICYQSIFFFMVYIKQASLPDYEGEEGGPYVFLLIFVYICLDLNLFDAVSLMFLS